MRCGSVRDFFFFVCLSFRLSFFRSDDFCWGLENPRVVVVGLFVFQAGGFVGAMGNLMIGRLMKRNDMK